MPIIVCKLPGWSKQIRPRLAQPLVREDQRDPRIVTPSPRRCLQLQTHRRRQAPHIANQSARKEYRGPYWRNTALARIKWHKVALDRDLKRDKSQILRILKESPLSPERSPDVIRYWRRIMGLRASIAAGAKPVAIRLSDGRQLYVYNSSRRHVNFLADGPQRSFEDIRCRLQEGEALALEIDIDWLRSSYSDQTTVKEHYSASERSTAIKVRRWLDDLSTRLDELMKTDEAVARPIETPLGILAQELFGTEPEPEPADKMPAKMPARTKWLSLASWPQIDEIQENVPLLGQQSSDGNLGTGVAPTPTEILLVGEGREISNEAPEATALPSKYEPIKPKMENFGASWTTRFERMRQGEGLNLRILNDGTIGSLIRTYGFTKKPTDLLSKASAVTYLQIVTHLQNVSQIEMWGDIMLWCLHNNPHGALRLLNATIVSEKLSLPQYVINDCLTHLAQHFLGTSKEPSRKAMQELWTTFESIMKTGVKVHGHRVIDDHVIYLMLRHSKDDQASSLLELCMKNNINLHANTLLHLLERSLKIGFLSMSVQILQGIAKSGWDLSSDQVQSACVKLIRTRVNSSSEYHVQTKLVTQILEMKIVPKVALYNAMILNCGDAGDFLTAWRLYQVGKANGLAADSGTYGVLFKSARLCSDTSATRNPTGRVLREVLRDPPAMQNLRILQDVLTAISLQHFEMHESPRIFKRMLGLYKKYCNLAPLKDLHICSPDEIQPQPAANFKFQWPTPWIVGQMIASFAHAHRGKQSLIEVFNRYRSMFLEGHPLVTEVAQSDFVGNAFTMAFGRRSETLHHCVAVLKLMLEDPIGNHSFSESDARSNRSTPPISDSSELIPSSNVELAPAGVSTVVRKPCRPTSRTWSVLLGAYISNGQKRAAEKITRLMEERGFQPDRVTWGKLISSYARMQDVDATVDSIERMQAAGYDIDVRTAGQLARLWDRERLLQALRSVTKPGDSATMTAKNIRKPFVQVTGGNEKSNKNTERRKQKEAELYLAGLPSQFNGGDQAPDPQILGPVLPSQFHSPEKDLISRA